jgi:hypothetical protein
MCHHAEGGDNASHTSDPRQGRQRRDASLRLLRTVGRQRSAHGDAAGDRSCGSPQCSCQPAGLCLTGLVEGDAWVLEEPEVAPLHFQEFVRAGDAIVDSTRHLAERERGQGLDTCSQRNTTARVPRLRGKGGGSASRRHVCHTAACRAHCGRHRGAPGPGWFQGMPRRGSATRAGVLGWVGRDRPRPWIPDGAMPAPPRAALGRSPLVSGLGWAHRG